MGDILVLVTIGVLGLFWMDGMQAREIAITAAKNACRRDGMQFLDDTVAIASLKLARNDRGVLKIRRLFQFEFSDTGDNRLEGNVVLLGKRVDTLYMAPHRIEIGES